MFWVWLSVIIATIIIEIATTDLVSIWFTFGAIIPLILSATVDINIWWQVVIFVLTSAILLACLRKVAVKYLFRNPDTKTNLDALVGQKFRMLESTDFDTIGKIKIKDVEWSAVGDKQQTIEKGEIVEIVSISGNKLKVKLAEEKTTQTNDKKNSTESSTEEKKTTKKEEKSN